MHVPKQSYTVKWTVLHGSVLWRYTISYDLFIHRVRFLKFNSISSIAVLYLPIHINVSVGMVLLDNIASFPHHQSVVSDQYVQKQKIIQYSIVCQSMPCKNGGTCYPIDSTNYVCVCPTSYTDRQCSTAIGMWFFCLFQLISQPFLFSDKRTVIRHIV